MVTITNGEKTFRVTSGSVKVYESMGFHIISDSELEEINQAVKEHYDDVDESEKSVDENDFEPDVIGKEEKEEEDTEFDTDKKDAKFIEELLEKPLTQWSSEEVKDFVRIKGIDTSGAQKVSQVRTLIKTYLDEQNKNA